MLAVAYYCVLSAVCGRIIYTRKEHNKDKKTNIPIENNIKGILQFSVL
jgi:hypothetical protein